MQKNSTASYLPRPSDSELALSQDLSESIINKIQENQGIISFAEYMQEALYAPGLGFYSNGAQKFGQYGNFMTAPEISSLFSYCLANQCEEILKGIHEGDILEFGAGSGKMAFDILTRLQKNNVLPKHYYILEMSASLKTQQQTLLKNFPNVEWLNALPGKGFQGVILANELLDALPHERFRIDATGAQRLGVSYKNQQFCFSLMKANCPEIEEILSPFVLPMLYESEVNLFIKPWIKTVAEMLEKGSIFIIDYGYNRQEYYHPQRKQGTLACYYRHYQHSDPFLYPGLQDITAHVDFTTVARTGVDAGLTLLGYCSQANFLLSAGLLELTQNLAALEDNKRYKLSQEILQLTSPHEMGELSKVLSLGRGIEHPSSGFRLKNLRDFLLA